MFRIAKKFRFEAGHRLLKHKGKCKNLHGHSYTAEVELCSYVLNKDGMVLDFYDLGFVKEWLDKYWDHAMILNERDYLVKDLCKRNSWKLYLLPNEPTAENMAEHLFEFVVDTLNSLALEKNFQVTRVTVWETAISYGEKVLKVT